MNKSMILLILGLVVAITAAAPSEQANTPESSPFEGEMGKLDEEKFKDFDKPEPEEEDTDPAEEEDEEKSDPELSEDDKAEEDEKEDDPEEEEEDEYSVLSKSESPSSRRKYLRFRSLTIRKCRRLCNRHFQCTRGSALRKRICRRHRAGCRIRCRRCFDGCAKYTAKACCRHGFWKVLFGGHSKKKFRCHKKVFARCYPRCMCK